MRAFCCTVPEHKRHPEPVDSMLNSCTSSVKQNLLGAEEKVSQWLIVWQVAMEERRGLKT